jgi:uncharacterized protein DUF6401
MTNEFLAFAPVQTPAAGPISDPDIALLDEMMARVGVDGLIAALTDPAVLARIDQHAAAVRDALSEAGRRADAAGLAAYAKSIAFAARRAGRPLPAPGAAPICGPGWMAADWHHMRLVAVCAIADANGLL